MPTRLLVSLAALLLTAAAHPLPAPLYDPNTTEGWIWERVQAGEIADLNDRCKTTPLDMHNREDPRWEAPCRRLDPSLLRALMTQPDLADRAPHGVRIRGARINGDLDLEYTHLRAATVWLDQSRITGGVLLLRARLDGPLSLDHTLVEGRLDADAAATSDLFMRGAVFDGPIDLRNAYVGNQIDMNGASIARKQTFDAEYLHVGTGGLILQNVRFGGSVNLREAHIEGQISMVGSSVADQQTFDAEVLRVGAGGLIMRNVKFGGHVDLHDAHIEGQMDMEAASVADKQAFEAQHLVVGTGLLLDRVKFGGPVDLIDAHAGGLMSMDGATLASVLEAERLHVEGAFFARFAVFDGSVGFRFLTVDGALDLRDSHVSKLDLGGASIRGDLLLGGRFADGSEHWLRWGPCDGLAPSLNLRNTRVGNLQDDVRAWPACMTLEGFTYTHLGGFGGEQRQDMRNRSIEWWRGWLMRDPVYSAQPYAQLASVLATAGNRDGAADIRFFGRDRERTELLGGCTWLPSRVRWPGLVEHLDNTRPCHLWPGLGMTALQLFVGYGIGDYGFRAVGWALTLALVGMVILLFAPGVRGLRPFRFLSTAPRGPRQRSLLWCFGASLHQVLPLVTINQEFSDFFNDPNRQRLYAWQHVAFGILALCGWALGLFVVAAFSGLIQS